MWLWNVKNYISFDEGYRVEAFIEFQNESQFETVATSLAEKALQEIHRYRQLFPNIHELRKYFLQNRPSGLWPNFHAGVASALDSEPEHARRFFKLVADSGNDDGVEWVAEAKKDAHELSIIAGDTTQFRQIISERVQKSRALQKLAERSDIDFDR